MQEIAIDFDALDNSYIDGMEFAFFSSLKEMDPFQPHLTPNERNYLVGDGDCGASWPLNKVIWQILNYWQADTPDDEYI